MKKKLFLVVFASFLLLSGCKEKAYELNIAEQFGIAYAPLAVMKEQGLLEKRLPGVTVNWKQFGGPTAIREGMLSGDIDIGFMGAAPVLIGIDNGMPWKYATGISMNEVALVCEKPYETLADFTAEDRIAILSPGCTQHVLLSLLAERQLGDAKAMDTRCVSLTHPDAMQALLSETEICAHVATPPYIAKELEAGMSVMATGEEILGEPLTFITGVAMTEFYEQRHEEYAAFLDALDEAIAFIASNPQAAAEQLAPIYGISAGELLEQMQGGVIYTRELKGIETLSEAMRRMGFTKSAVTLSEAAFPDEKGA